MVRPVLFSCQCARCGREFTAPFVAGLLYGVLGARSAGRDTLIAIETFEDPVFEEARELSRRCVSELRVNLTDRREADVFWSAWSAVCDPDENGTRFVIGAMPRCPDCGSRDVNMLRETSEIGDVHLPAPCYPAWHSMTSSEKALTIRAAVTDACRH